MLQKIREQSNRWYIKTLLVVLVVSFGLWGVTDIFLNYVHMRPVATVDSHSITQEEFASRLQSMVTKAQEASKGRITPDQIKEMGIPQKVLDTLIDHSLIMKELNKRHLVITDTAVRNHVHSIPAFLNEQGVFDKRAFDYLLHNNHITEAKFIADVRAEMQQNQLFSALTAGLNLPKSYVDLLFRGFFEQRVFAVTVVPFDKMVVKESPKDGELEDFYKQNQSQFSIPETRKFTLLEINPKQLKDQITLSTDKLQEEYERRKTEFEIAEKREIKQINFKDEETANKAVDSLKKGRPVPAAARDLKGEFKDLGLVTKPQLPDLVADRLFESDLGQVTGPISTPFGWQVYVVSKIQPSSTKAFSEIRTQLEADLKTQLANDQIYELKNKIEDALGGGATLAEIAKDHHFKVQAIDAVTKSGTDRDGKPVLPDIGKDQILEEAFSLAQGADSAIIDTKEGISYVVHLDTINATYVPAFSDIKDKIGDAWKESKRFDLAMIVAQQLAKDAQSVSDLTRLSLSRKLTIKMLDPLSRVDSEKDEKIHKQFSPQLVHQIFELKVGKCALGVTPDRANGGIQVVMLQKIIPFDPKPLKEKREQMDRALADMAFKDALALYLKNLRSQASISVNQDIYMSIVNRG